MAIPTIRELDNLYNQFTDIHCLSFENSNLAHFNLEISTLQKQLGELQELSIWPSVIASLKKLRFDLITLPIPSSTIITPKLLDNLNIARENSRRSFPEYEPLLLNIINLAQHLKGEKNSLFEWIKSNNVENSCLCILTPNYIKAMENIINNNINLRSAKLKVTSPRSLKEFRFFRRIIFCGSANLYTENQYRDLEYTWRSPRASELYFLSYKWIRDVFDPRPSLDTTHNKVPFRVRKKTIPEAMSSTIRKQQPNEADITVSVNEIDFSPIELIITPTSTGVGYYESICESKMFLLEDGTAICKEVEGKSKIISTINDFEVITCANNKLEPGNSIIVRTGGAGDSIAAVADMLLGDKTSKIRGIQQHWKSAFRAQLDKHNSLNLVVQILASMGAPTANEVNIRNWQRGDTIKPQNKEDFQAIMTFSGLSEKVDDYWNNAKVINQMHIQAGKKISKLLLSKITTSNISELEKYGRIDIEVEGLSGKLSVVTIDAILPETFQIPHSQLDKIIAANGGTLWPG